MRVVASACNKSADVVDTLPSAVQVLPFSVYCQLPLVVSAPNTAMPNGPLPSTSVTDVSKVDTKVPALLASSSNCASKLAQAFSTGASFTAMPVNAFVPETLSAPSLTLVATLKLPLKLSEGVNVNPASSAFTLPVAPRAVHTPVPAL